jgi:hypothetical protein
MARLSGWTAEQLVDAYLRCPDYHDPVWSVTTAWKRNKSQVKGSKVNEDQAHDFFGALDHVAYNGTGEVIFAQTKNNPSDISDAMILVSKRGDYGATEPGTPGPTVLLYAWDHTQMALRRWSYDDDNFSENENVHIPDPTKLMHRMDTSLG